MGGWNKPLEGLNIDVSEHLHVLEYATSLEAWSNLNEMFLVLDNKIFSKGAVANSGVAAAYNMFIHIRNSWMDPDFNFGRMFNYTESKWSSLLNNYIDFNKLDLMRSRLRVFQNKYNQNYNLTYTFNNHHDNGKQCLIAVTFSKRFQTPDPVVTVIMRASEITKRLAFDLLLIQRIIEYVYGKGKTLPINIFASQMYGNIETLIMYDTYKPLKTLLKGVNNPFTEKVKEVYKKFKQGEEKNFSSFKVFFRSFKVVRPDLYTYKPLYAKDLVLEFDDIEYPEDCITYRQRSQYKKKYLQSKR